MKTKQKTLKRGAMDSCMNRISEERILQLFNDFSEGEATGTVKDWRAVALYWRNALNRAINDINAIRPSVAAMYLGQECIKRAHSDMAEWLKRVKS